MPKKSGSIYRKRHYAEIAMILKMEARRVSKLKDGPRKAGQEEFLSCLKMAFIEVFANDNPSFRGDLFTKAASLDEEERNERPSGEALASRAGGAETPA